MTGIGLLGALFLGAFALADTTPTSLSTYVLRRYPQRNVELCRDEVQAIARRLEKEKSVSIYEATCVRGPFGGTDAKISYYAEPPLRLVSTDWGYGVQGFFSSLETCEKDLPRQREMYQRATGIEPFHAYCMNEETWGLLSYAPRVDGFGDAAMRPRFFEGYLTGAPAEGLTSLQNRIQKSLSKNAEPLVSDFAVTSTEKISATSSGYLLRSRYYSRRDAPWYLAKGDFQFQSVGECEAQTRDLNTSLEAAGIVDLVSFCTWDGLLFRAESNQFLTRLGPWYSIDSMPEAYESVSSCLAARQKAVSFYTDKLKKKVVATMCSVDRSVSYPVRHKLRVLLPCRSVIDPLCHRIPEFPWAPAKLF